MALPKVSLLLVAGSLLAATALSVASAQNITIDGRFSAAQTLTGPYYSIGANLGRQVGSNLFHSFGQFSLVKGDTAAFTSTGGTAPINNVIGRVTGGSRSDIDGKIQSNIANANLFLINPSGIVFGPNATVNVSGAFHASTADYIKMGDGAKFQATHPDGSTLSAAPPAAFGFLTASPARISVNGSTLSVPTGQTLGLVGGPVSIAATSPTSTTGATLSAPAGTIHVTSAAGTGEVPVDPRNKPALTVSKFGPVDIKGGTARSILTASNPSGNGAGGSVFIRSDTLSVDAGGIAADNFGSGPGGQLVLRGETGVRLSNGTIVQARARGSGSGGNIILRTAQGGAISIDNSTVTVGSLATGDGGKLSVKTGQLFLTSRGALQSSTQAGGNGGPIKIKADSVVADGGDALDQTTGIFSSIAGSGNAGSISIIAGQLALRNDANVLACAGVPTCTPPMPTQSLGSGGVVDVNVGGPLTVESGAFLGTEAFAAWNAGEVSVITSGPVTVDHGLANKLTGIGSLTFGAGNAGDVSVISSGRVTVDHGAAKTLTGTTFTGIESLTFGAGKAGDVSVIASGAVTIDHGSANTYTGIGSLTFGKGNGGDVSVKSLGMVSASGGVLDALTGIFARAESRSTGNSGSVTVTAGNLSIANAGLITASTFGSGEAGNVTISVADRLAIDGSMAPPGSPTGILSQANGESTGNAGDATVDTGTLSIVNRGVISATSFGTGKGGNLTISVADGLTIDGTMAPGSFTGLGSQSDVGAIGNAGNITVSGEGTIALFGGGKVSTATVGAGDGGTIRVTAQAALTLSGPATGIFASALPNSSGKAGSVFAAAPRIALTSGARITSITAGTGGGGSVTVTTPGALLLDGGGDPNTRISTSATGPQSGQGGRVAVEAGSLTIQGGAQIASTTAGPGKGGDVNVKVASDIMLPDGGPQITAQSTGSGDAGSITVSAVRLRMDSGAAISAEAETSTANGGNITLKLNDLLYLTNSKIATSVHGETGNGGNILIDPQLVVLNHSSIIAEAVEGHGGNITINAGAFIPSADSVVSASSQLGISGTVLITGPRVDVNGALVVLSSELRGRAAVLREACAARGDRPISSLVEAGRGGLPQDPEATLPALYIADRDLNPNPQAGAGKAEASGAPLQTTVRLTMHCA